MKQATIQISFDDEKLKALKRYIAKRDSTVEAELQKAIQRLYEKVVPPPVREYIDEADLPEDKPMRRVEVKP